MLSATQVSAFPTHQSAKCCGSLLGWACLLILGHCRCVVLERAWCRRSFSPFPSFSTIPYVQVQPVTELLGWNTNLPDSCAHQQTTSLNLIKMSFLCLISHLLALIKTVSPCIPGGPNFLWVPSASCSSLYDLSEANPAPEPLLRQPLWNRQPQTLFLEHSQSLLQRSSPPPRATSGAH